MMFITLLEGHRYLVKVGPACTSLCDRARPGSVNCEFRKLYCFGILPFTESSTFSRLVTREQTYLQFYCT